MVRKMYLALCMMIIVSLLVSCIPRRVTPTPKAGMPNPASAFCEEQGGKVDIRSDASGAQAGICIFPDGSECDEWAYYRGECAPRDATPQAPTVAP